MNKKTQKPPLNNFFNPKTIAVVGASANKEKLGHSILKNILDYKYKGKIFPVNLKGEKVLGLKSYQSVLDIKSKIDLAIIVIPAKAVNSVLEKCGKAKIKNVIIISAGFKEIGGDGIILEEKMKEIAEKYNIKIIGPNCLGILDSVNNLNASFANGMVKKGSIGFISQSGAICTAMLDWANLNNVGFSKFVSLGNKSVVSEVEMIEFFKNDKKTKAVLAYIESVNYGKKFMKAAAELVKIKPLIIIKSGTSKASQKAMQSHTGALANKEDVVKTAFRQVGIIRVDNLEELFNIAKFLSRNNYLNGNKIAIVTNAGGPGVICTDEIENNGLKLASLEKKTIEVLKKNLPVETSVNNPVDLIGDAKADRYEIAAKTLLLDKNVDGVISILTPQTVTEISKTAEVLLNLSKKSKKPLLTSFIGGVSIESEARKLNNSQLAFYNYPSQAVFSLSRFWQYQKSQKIASNYLKAIKENKIIGDKKKYPTGNLNLVESLNILKSAKIPVIESLLANNCEEAIKLARKIKYPVVMKIFSDKISHKTEVEGVRINIKNDFEVREYYNEIYRKLGNKIGGIIIQPMVKGMELILGLKKDKNFGHLIMFGFGGVYAEIIKDVSFRLAPINKTEALKMIEETKSFEILNGYRKLPRMDINSLADSLAKLSDLISVHPEIEELDINPLMVKEKGSGCWAVDARIKIE